ncbi:MAG TPA: alpha/beta hydrolase [Acidimicrobiales bacterium]
MSVHDVVGANETEIDGIDGDVDHGLTRDGIVQLRRRWRARTDGTEPLAAMLLLHGIGEHSGRYAKVASRLAAAGIDVVAIDNRGFGGSGGRRAYVRSFDEFVDDAADQLAELRALGAPTVLFGHSMGGLIALLVVLEHRQPSPDLLVLSAPALGAQIPSALRRVAPVVAKLAPTLPVPSPINTALLSSDPTVGSAFRADKRNVHVVTPALGSELLRAAEWANAHVDELDVPTLVLHGSDDHIVPLEATACLEELPCVERRVLDGLRHEPHHEPSYRSWVQDVVAWVRRSLHGTTGHPM